MIEETSASDLLAFATELTMAWLSNPNTRAAAEDVPSFLQTMHGAVVNLATPKTPPPALPAAEYIPAVTPRRSLASKDHIISMIDGKPYKVLKRHLTEHGLTPAEYRARFGLRPDYPMVAANYAEMRRGIAKRTGLGRKPGAKVAAKSSPKSAPAKAALRAAEKKAPRTAKASAEAASKR